MMEMFYISDGHSSYIAMGHLICGQCDCGTESKIEFKYILTLNSHVWLLAAVLEGTHRQSKLPPLMQ